TTLDGGTGFGEGFAVLAGDAAGEFLEAVEHDLAEFEEDADALDDGDGGPFRQRGGCGFHDGIDFVGGAEGNLGDHLSGGGVEDVAEASRSALRPLSGAQDRELCNVLRRDGHGFTAKN